ncbi:MAG: uracil-DNA glycosylase [Thermoplasmata archaeon]|nr:uracil-DNA glycosylase [Thermoplasmata archaeon]
MSFLSPDPDCSLCGLCSGRTNIVLPSGDPSSPVLLVGEGPGENEDLKGMPFIGRAGSILDGIMAEAGLPREKVLITNTVKCRPPGNRDPTEEEMAACRRFLDSEMESRALVVGLGKSAIRDLMGYTGPMGPVVNRKTKITVNGKEVDFLPTYHPMACVYRKAARESLLEAMRMIKEEFY